MVRVFEIIWMFVWDWLEVKFPIEQERFNLFEPERTDLLFKNISVFKKTLWIYAELRPRILKAIWSNFCGLT